MTYNEQDKNTAVLKVYADIGWWGTNATDFSNTIEQLSARYENIIIRVHCYGGNVFEGNAIYNALKASKANTTIRIEGVSASMMTIVQAGAKRRQMVENGLMMIHCPTTWISGNAAQLGEAAKLLTSLEKMFIRTYAKQTLNKKTEADIKALFDGSDHWFDAEEALAWGFIDEIIPAEADSLPKIEKPVPGTDPETIYNRFAAAIAPDNDFPKKQTTAMKQLLITTLALTGVTEQSSDQDVANAVKAKFDGLQNQLQANVKASSEALIVQAETARGENFTPEQKNSLLAVGQTSGIATLQMVLGLQIPAPAASAAPASGTPNASAAPAVLSMIAGGPAASAAPEMDWDEWQEKNPKGLAQMEHTDFKKFSALFKAKYGVEPDR
jgi:ATP-dependent protease ClpP protease subunit